MIVERKSSMSFSGFILGAVAGAVATWLLDPVKGGERRQMLMDKANSLGGELKDFIGEKADYLTGKGEELSSDVKSGIKGSSSTSGSKNLGSSSSLGSQSYSSSGSSSSRTSQTGLNNNH